MTPFRGEGGILAIKDATRLGELFHRINTSSHHEMESLLNQYQEEVTTRGSQAVALASSAMAKATAGDFPMCWGHRSQPIEKVPLDLQL